MTGLARSRSATTAGRLRAAAGAALLAIGAASMPGCAVGDGAYGDGGYEGGYYEPYGYEVGGWGGGYHVGPGRDHDRGDHRGAVGHAAATHAYRAPPAGRSAPSIPSHSRR
jgi:hypothetical protein